MSVEQVSQESTAQFTRHESIQGYSYWHTSLFILKCGSAHTGIQVCSGNPEHVYRKTHI